MELAAVATVLAAMAGLLKLVLDHLRREGDKFDEAIEKADTRHIVAVDTLTGRQERFLANHIDNNTQALQGMSTALGALVETSAQLHTDNLNAAKLLVEIDNRTARVLKKADTEVVRKVKEQNHPTVHIAEEE